MTKPTGIEDVRRMGASGNGETDDRTALFNANKIGANLYLAAGTYRVASNLTLSVPLSFESGAILKPDAGVTITVNAPINAGPWQIFNVNNAESSVTGAVKVPYFYSEWFGADPTGAVDCINALGNTIALTQSSGGGTITLIPGGTYRSAGGLTVNLTHPLRILGAGKGITGNGQGATRFTHTGNNTCFNFQAGVNVWASVTLEDMEIQGPTTGSSAIFASFSDSWGNKLKNLYVFGYGAGIQFQLWNNVGWTEGFIVEDVMMRQFAAGFGFKRTSGSGGTDSFFGFRTRNLSMAPGPGGIGFLLNSTAKNNLTLYGANIDVQFWFEYGGTRGFMVGEYSVFVQSLVNVMQDGIPITTGTDSITFYQLSSAGNDANGGYINIDGKVRAQQGADFYNTSALGATASINIHRQIVHPSFNKFRSAVPAFLNLPSIRVKGAAVTVGDIAQTINKTLTFVNFQPGTRYRAHLHLFAVGGASVQEASYEICHLDSGLISPVTKVSGLDSVNAFCRNLGGAAAGSAGTGLAFDLVINAATIGVSCSYTLELEML